MDHTEAGEQPGSLFWADPAWLDLYDGMLAGLRHEVSGRAGALRSLSSLATRGLGEDGWLVEELQRESGKLEALVRVLQAVPMTGPEREVAVSLGDVLGSLQGALRLVRDLHDATVEVEVAPQTPAVQVGAGALSAVVLVLLADCLRSSGEMHARVAVSPNGEGATALLQSTRAGAEQTASPSLVTKKTLRHAQALLSPWAATLTTVGNEGCWRVKLRGV